MVLQLQAYQRLEPGNAGLTLADELEYIVHKLTIADSDGARPVGGL